MKRLLTLNSDSFQRKAGLTLRPSRPMRKMGPTKAKYKAKETYQTQKEVNRVLGLRSNETLNPGLIKWLSL